MKKLLLACLAASSAFGAMAGVETKIINDFIVGLSTDGKYASSEFYGSISIYDLDTDEHYDYAESGNNSYGVGSGNFWGSGAMVGYVNNSGGSAIWRGGRWTKLPLAAADPAGMGIASGITPDMTRICGNASTGVGLVLDDAKLMVYPCYWDARENGSFGQQMPLPYPTTDFMGQVPQYVTAVSITADGKTIWGQITSGNGFFHEPIVYKQAEDGTWTYETPLRDKILPEGIEVVPYPGDGPMIPSMENFMTEEELAAYDAAYQKYLENPTSIPEPRYEQFMTNEEIEEYNKALEPHLEWLKEYEKYEAMLNQLMEKSLTFVLNLVYVSPNGRYMASAAEVLYMTAEGRTQSIYCPYIYDTQTGEGKVIGMQGFSMSVTGVNDEGDVLGYMDAGGADLGYVYHLSTNSWEPYGEYLTGRAPELAKWIADNWVHEVEVEIDAELGDTDFVDLEISGRPFVSADWNAFSSVAYNFWGGANKGEYLSYVVRFDGETAIEDVNVETKPGKAVYYDLQGRRVLSPSNGVFIKVEGGKSAKISL